jgi:hypothetical protein
MNMPSKLIILLGIVVFLSGLLFYGQEEVWQTPYTDKSDIVHYKGSLYEVRDSLKFPHRTIPTDIDGIYAVQVKDFRYMNWLNTIRKLIVYSFC